MDGNFVGSKKIEITVPENMSEDTVNRCFMMGIHDFLCVNGGGISVNYGIENGKGEIFLQSMSFNEDYAVAIRRFCEAIRLFAGKNSKEEQLVSFREEGKKILEDLENGTDKRTI